MPFIVLVATVAFTVAAAAAYFSVYGLALIFSGAIIPVIIMASALEVGKLCATSILYNYWHQLGVLMRTYYVGAIFVLMLITSGGIYGFLSAAYQQDKLPLEQINQRIELLDAEYERKTQRLKQMDDIIASIGANYISKRLEEKEQQRPEREELVARINQIESERLELSTKQIETEAHIGPVIYMAEVFGKTPDQATNYLILLFIFVFDPLAVALTISVNMLVSNYKQRKQETIDEEPSTPDNGTTDDQNDDMVEIPSLVPRDFSSYTTPILGDPNFEIAINRVSDDEETPPKHEFKMDNATFSPPEIVIEKTPEQQVVTFDDSKLRDLMNEHNRSLTDVMVRMGTKTHKDATQTVDEIKQALSETVKELKDVVRIPEVSEAPEETPTVIVDQETHDRADAKLEKRRALIRQIRGNKLS